MSAHTIAWSERLDLTLAQARQRSQLVNLLRRLFVGLAGAALASVFVFMALFSPEGLWGSAYAQVTPLRVLAPRFTGTSESGEAYQLTADVAAKDDVAARFMTLAAPVYRSIKGQMLMAPRGVYDEQTQTINMEGGVLFTDGDGNRFSSPGMVVDLEAGVLRGERGVTGAGPLGVVRADAYELRTDGSELRLSGGVRGQVPDRSEGADNAVQGAPAE
jgi:lipopolysaccharide export system protein LptC